MPARADGDATQTTPWERSALATAVGQAVESANNLDQLEDGLVDVVSQAGRDAMEVFFRSVHAIGDMLAVAAAPRAHDAALSERIVAICTDQGCPYSIQIFAASVRGSLNFNSQEHPMSSDAMVLAAKMQLRMEQVCEVLDRLHAKRWEDWDATDETELLSSFSVFDEAWAAFEEQFFAELPGIEADPRGVLVEAMHLVGELDRIAGSLAQNAASNDLMQNPEFVRFHNGLIACISRLNLAANPGSTGRSFAPGLLQEVETVVEDGLAQLRGAAGMPSAPFILAGHALVAWDELCCYLFQTRGLADQFWPELSRNAELVRLLAAWESSWALASAHVADPRGRAALSGLVDALQEARAGTPALAAMIDEGSAELFMVLPRLVWLRFLEDPSRIMPVVAPLLPHRFGEEPGGGHGIGAAARRLDPELAAFMEHSGQVGGAISRRAQAAEAGRHAATAQVRAGLTRIAALGSARLPGSTGTPAEESRRVFLLRLESWSMELQHTHEQHWCRLSALLMRCLGA